MALSGTRSTALLALLLAGIAVAAALLAGRPAPPRIPGEAAPAPERTPPAPAGAAAAGETPAPSGIEAGGRPAVTTPRVVHTALRVRVEGLPEGLLPRARLVVFVGGEEIRAPLRDDGVFLIWNLPADRPHDLRLAFDRGPAEILLAEGVVLRRQETRELVLPIGEVALLTGRVEDGAGRPLEAARVTLVPAQHDWKEAGTPVRARTDREGQYVITELAPPEHRLLKLVVDAVDRGFVPEERLVRLRPGLVLDVRVRLEPGLRVGGRVLDPKGRPVAGAEVCILERLLAPAEGEEGLLPVTGLVTTDADGRFADDAYRRGPYRIVVRGELDGKPFLVEQPSVPAGREDLTIRFAGFGGLDLRFRDARTGAPVPVMNGVVERVWAHDGDEEEFEDWSDFAGKAAVAIGDLPAGPYRVCLTHPGYEDVLSDLVVVEAGKRLGPLEYALTPSR